MLFKKKKTAKILTFSVCVVPENTLSDTSPTVEVGFCHRPCWILDVEQLFNSSEFINNLCLLYGYIFHSAIFKKGGKFPHWRWFLLLCLCRISSLCHTDTHIFLAASIKSSCSSSHHFLEDLKCKDKWVWKQKVKLECIT